MGWLGWTPETALKADVRHVVMAIEGHTELLLLQAGKSPDEMPSKQRGNGRITADKFRTWSRRHNETRRATMKVPANG